MISLSTDARAFHDQQLRARALARIADALWAVDPDHGRLLFRKSWEAAEVADRISQEKVDEEIRQKTKPVALTLTVRRQTYVVRC